MESENLKLSHPHIDATELATQMRNATERPRVLEEVETPQPFSPEPGSKGSDPHYQPPRLTLEPHFVPAKDDRYHVANLCKFTGAEFVDAAYRAILKREPDAAGVGFYLESLQQGRFDRLDVILALLSSEEGKRKRVQIEGLTAPLWLRRVNRLPVIGPSLRYVIDFLRAPILIRRLEQLTAVADARNQQITNHVNLISRESSAALSDGLTRVNSGLSDVADTFGQQISGVKRELTQSIAERAHATEQLRDEMRATIERKADATRTEWRQELATLDSVVANGALTTESKIDALHDEIAKTVGEIQKVRGDAGRLTEQTDKEFASLSIGTQRLRQEIAVQRARLALFEQAAEVSDTARAREPGSILSAAGNLDALYAELEDHFRGTSDTLKQSFEFYLPYIQSLPNADLTVVDLGCGRGEWLEVLSEDGVKAIGVDDNRVMIESCTERSLAVVESDGLAYLREQPSDTLRAVTAFHLIEHLPTEKLVALLDEIMRTLQPGGAVILETPNPDNLFVASNYFYHDPTHRNPLPSRLTRFLVESRGFARVEIINLHECAEGRFTGSDEVSVRLNELFYGPMDYAIVGWKHDQ